MQADTIYIKVEQDTQICNKKIFLQDVVKMYCTDKSVLHALEKKELCVVKSVKDTKYVMSILKIIEIINREYPNLEVVNLGEQDFIISYRVPKKDNQLFQYVKAGIICVIVGLGSAFSIMTFNTDVSVSDVFDKAYELVLGNGAKGNGIVELAYAIGLPLGICVFFDHFRRTSIKNDPTPLEVEMRVYEEQVNKALIKNGAREGKMIDVDV